MMNKKPYCRICVPKNTTWQKNSKKYVNLNTKFKKLCHGNKTMKIKVNKKQKIERSQT